MFSLNRTRGAHSISRNLLCAASATALALSAAPLAAQSGQAQSVTIEAQSLDAALVEVGRRYGVSILAPDSLTRGKRAPRVSGNLTAREAIGRILAGSGLTVTGSRGEFNVTRASARTQQTSQTQTARSSTREEQQADIIVSGVRYSDPETPLTRAPAEIREIPNSVTVLNSEIIEDQVVIDINDVLGNIAGIVLTADNDLTVGSGQVILRGLEDSAIPSLLRENSLPGGLTYRPDPYSIERIEVIKGPAAIAGGGAVVGGLINRQLKVADGGEYSEAILTADTFGFFRAGIDVGGTLDEAETTSGRLIVVGGAGNDERDLSDRENFQILGSLNFEIGSATQLTVQGQYLFRGGNPSNGVEFNNQTDGLPDLDPQQSLIRDDEDVLINQDHHSGQIDLVHEFLDDLTLTARLGYAETDGAQVQIYPFNYGAGLPADGVANVYAGFTGNDFSRFAGDVFLTKTFDFLGQDSSIVVGVDYFEQRQDFVRTFNFLGTEDLFNISTPFSAPDDVRENITFIDNETSLDQFGAYTQVILRPTPELTLMGGLRYDTFEQDSALVRDTVAGAGISGDVDGNSNAFTWRAGASYEVMPEVTLYGSYATSFLANTFAITIDNSLLDPEQGEQFEVGLKTSLFDDRLSATLAAFTIDRTNTPIADPNATPGLAAFTTGGDDAFDGIELELAGEPIEGLRILGAYTYIDARIVEDGNPATGVRRSAVPDHRISLFGTYEFEQGALQGFGFGGRVEFQSRAPFTSLENSGFAPSYVTFDLTAFYRDILPGADLRIYVQNVTDETFFPVGGNVNGFGGFGPVRNATASLIWDF